VTSPRGITETERLAHALPSIYDPYNPGDTGGSTDLHGTKIVRAQQEPSDMGEDIMTTRRDFLKTGTATATGIFFCGCGLLRSAHAQEPARQKLPVMVGGKRVKTIDVHSHCNFHEAGALLGEEGPKLQAGPVNGAEESFIDLKQRLAAMDAQAVDMEILSINPFWYNRERDLAAQIVKIQN